MSSAEDELAKVHQKIGKFNGNLKEEYTEQIMAMQFIAPDATVIELGGNIGRNSCVIGTILNNSERLVVFETDKISAGKLRENRDLCELKFKIETAALSSLRLQQKNWLTIPIENFVWPDWVEVDTMKWSDLLEKYNLNFDTLVADCEGALFYILSDTPELLDNIKTIIIENDFLNDEHKTFVHNIFISKGFKVVYSENLNWGVVKEDFYQTWKRE